MNSAAWAALCVAGVLAAGCGSNNPSSATSAPTSVTGPSATPAPSTSSAVTWGFDTSWQPSAAPPACPSPLVLGTPVDLSLVTSILYPGQVRGEYKPHGGFRLDGANQANEVTITAPLDGVLDSGVRYLEQGEVQYLFTIIHPCGIMYRFDHLLTLAPRFQAIAETLPAPRPDDTRGTRIPGEQAVVQGEVMATAVGHRSPRNIGFDWGVYDLRSRNAAAADPAWLAAHGGDQAPYAICWLDFLGADSARVRSLPAGDQAMGSTSDYCR
ncbi:MAG: hypothetical protein AB7P99_18365 [Vicinamibacterales bacterium]